MALVKEDIPMMALVEDSAERQVYVYQANRWLLLTVLPGIALFGGAVWMHFVFEDIELLITLPLFMVGALFLYSSLYSLTADQWLMFDGVHQLVRFHKKNIYGRIDWEFPGREIKCIRVMAQEGKNSWVLQLKVNQQQDLLFSDSAFAKMSRGRAMELAEKAGQLSGIRVDVLE